MPWVRSGECPPERCKGRCCTHIGTFMDVTGDAYKFAKMLQHRGGGVSVAVVGDKYFVDVPQRCQWLTGRGLCQLHPAMKPSQNLPRRPQMCDEWPTEPSQTLGDPECGYRFTWVDEELDLRGNV